MTVVLDAGALVAVDRRDRSVGAMLRVVHDAGVGLITSGAVVAQVWRDGARQANLARVLAAVDIAALDARAGRQVGALLGRSGTSDVVDGHIATLIHDGDRLLTSDVADLTGLLDASGTSAEIVAV